MGYYYDWTARPLPYSNDPRGCIAPSVVTVDGQRVSALTCESGPDGWAEVAVKDADGAFVIEHWQIKTKRLSGHVKVNGEG